MTAVLAAALRTASILIPLVGGLAACGRIEPEKPHDAPVFTEVTTEAGLGAFRHRNGASGKKWMPETFSSGGGFVDYDGDGWADVLLVGGASWPGEGDMVPALELFRNDRDGTFSNVTSKAGLSGYAAYGFGFSAADYDNDGDEDIFLTTLSQDFLLRNEGGRFVEVAAAAGVAGNGEWGTASVFFDADGDGWSDLYVGNYVPWTAETDIVCTSDGRTKDYCTPHQYRGQQGRFFHNNGNGTFTDFTESAGFGEGPGKTLGAVEMDFNDDGLPDLAVANDTQPNLLYVNRGGFFEEIGITSGIAFDANGRSRAGMGIDAGVVDSSGRTSLVIGNFSDEMTAVYTYAGNNLFLDRSASSQVGLNTLQVLTFGIVLFDFDLDSDQDLLMANGHIIENVERMQPDIKYRQPAQLYVNDGGGKFVKAAFPSPSVFDTMMVARALATADYDQDGDLDILFTENGGRVHLWRNEVRTPEGPNYLRVRLLGDTSFPDPLGARVRVKTAGLWQERRVRTGGSYLAQSEKTATFGLGKAMEVDSLEIRWPDGTYTHRARLSVNRTVTVRKEAPAIQVAEKGPPRPEQ